MVRRAASRLLLAALALTALVRGARAQDEVPLGIVAPEKLVLGVDREAVLQIRAPLPLTASLTTNLGSLGTPEPSGPGEWRVRYTPPSTRYPQIAIFALVSADGAQLAWARTALHGSASVELRSDPQVQVSVKVGETTFGPVQTDARGAASIAVVVPPGVARASSAATDALGNVRVESIPLDVPEITPLLAVCPAEDARDFLVLATRPDGTPASRLALVASATTVEAGEVREAEPGVYRAALTLPDAVQAGQRAQLSARLGAEPAAAVSCELAVPLERPTRLRVELSRARFVAGESEPIVVRVLPEYPGVREKAAFRLRLKTDLGELSDTRLSAREALGVTWRLPRELQGRSQAELSITGDLRQTLVLPLSAAVPSELALQPSHARLVADGHSSILLRATARDAYGNPVRGAHLSSQARGALQAFAERAPGEYEAEYRAPLAPPGEDRIVVRDADSGREAAASFELLGRSGPLALAAHAGYLSNFARVSGPLLELELAYRLPVLAERLALGLVLGYYQSSASVSAADGGETLRAKLWAFPLLLRASYTIPVGALDLAPLLGAGALAASSGVDSAASGSIRERHFAPLLMAGLGAKLGLGPGRLCLTLGYFHAALHGDSVQGNAGGAHLTLGYELAF